MSGGKNRCMHAHTHIIMLYANMKKRVLVNYTRIYVKSSAVVSGGRNIIGAREPSK